MNATIVKIALTALALVAAGLTAIPSLPPSLSAPLIGLATLIVGSVWVNTPKPPPPEAKP
jgi:hypothetical protein